MIPFFNNAAIDENIKLPRLIVPTLCVGTGVGALCNLCSMTRRRASTRCVPTQSVGTMERTICSMILGKWYEFIRFFVKKELNCYKYFKIRIKEQQIKPRFCSKCYSLTPK